MENDELILLELKDIKEDVRGIQACLNGNGKPGLCTRVAAVENTTSTIKKVVWWAFTTAGAVVLGFVTTTVFHIKIG